MKKIFLLMVFLSVAARAELGLKISDLPLLPGASVVGADSFPIVDVTDNKTKRVRFQDLYLVPSIASKVLVNPMTTMGDLIVGGTAGVPTRVAAGTSGYVWTSNGAGVAPSWQVGGGGGVAWGAITGTLSSQADLASALSGKQATGNYLTGLTGDVTASGPGNASATVSNAAVIAKVLTGFSPLAGSVSSSSSVLDAFNKVVGNMALLAPLASPTFTGTVTLGTVGSIFGSSGDLFIRGTGTYGVDGTGVHMYADASAFHNGFDVTDTGVGITADQYNLTTGFFNWAGGSGITNDRALYLDSSGYFKTSATTSAQLALLSTATNANTASTLVKRDGSGNFSAGTVTASSFVGPVTGNASTATALAAAPSPCTAGMFVTAVAANGTLTCATPSGGGTTPPPITAHLALNLDATNCATTDCTLATGRVATWNDLSGNGRNHTNGDPDRYPTYTASGIHGKPSLSFDTTGPNNLAAQAAVNLTQWSAYIVTQWTTPLAAFFLISPAGTTGGILTGDATTFELYDGGSYTDFSAPHVVNTPYIYQIIAPTNPASAAVYQTDTTLSQTGTGGSTWSMNYQNVGSRGSAPGNGFNGLVGQFLLYEVAHTNFERAQVLAFLKTRWGF